MIHYRGLEDITNIYYCEGCGLHVDELSKFEGEYFCEDCIDGMSAE